LGNAWCAMSSCYAEFVAGRFVAGLGASLILTTAVVVLADISTPSRRGRIMAIYQGTFLFAVGVGPLPGGVVAERFGLAAPFWGYAALSAVASLIAWGAVQETRDYSPNGVSPGERLGARAQFLRVMQHRGFRLVGIVGLV